MSNVDESKYIRDLKKQNSKLKQENQQLRKINNKLQDQIVNFFDELPENEPEVKKEKNKSKCPSCGSYNNVEFFSAGPYNFYKCLSCNKKGKI